MSDVNKGLVGWCICLELCVHNHMLGCMQHVKTPKETWPKIYALRFLSLRCNLQLWKELNDAQQKGAYPKYRDFMHSLASTHLWVSGEDMVHVAMAYHNISPKLQSPSSWETHPHSLTYNQRCSLMRSRVETTNVVQKAKHFTPTMITIREDGRELILMEYEMLTSMFGTQLILFMIPR